MSAVKTSIRAKLALKQSQVESAGRLGGMSSPSPPIPGSRAKSGPPEQDTEFPPIPSVPGVPRRQQLCASNRFES